MRLALFALYVISLGIHTADHFINDGWLGGLASLSICLAAAILVGIVVLFDAADRKAGCK